jgi:hypothetical protein
LGHGLEVFSDGFPAAFPVNFLAFFPAGFSCRFYLAQNARPLERAMFPMSCIAWRPAGEDLGNVSGRP